VLLAATIMISVGFDYARLPAALLIGPMVAAILCSVYGIEVRLPRASFNASQIVIGCLIASSIELAVFVSFLEDWPVILAAVFSTIAASSFLGWSISRLKILPGTTALWGSSPGAATAMVLMASAFGADARLVAFMQYLRVIVVSIAAALVAGFFIDTSGVPVPAIVWFPPIDWTGLLSMLAIGAAGGLLGRLIRLPSPYFLGSFVLGAGLQLTGYVEFALPPWLLGASYVVIGWTIGLYFDRPVLAHAARAFPQILLSVVILIGFCGAIAWYLSHELGVDPLTAYLATSPGGLDTVAIIAAASSSVNLSLVIALQTARFVIVLAIGPPLARLIARSLRE